MRGEYLARVRKAWGSKRALAAVLGCSRRTITRNEGRRYVTHYMKQRMLSRRGLMARRFSRGYWRADGQIQGGKSDE